MALKLKKELIWNFSTVNLKILGRFLSFFNYYRILHYSFHAQSRIGEGVQCETLAVTEVLERSITQTKRTFNQKALFFHCEGRFSLLFDSTGEQMGCHPLLSSVLNV